METADTVAAPRRRTLLRMIRAGGAAAALGATLAACGKDDRKAAAERTGSRGTATTTAAVTGSGAPGPDTVMIIRHGEKPKEEGDSAPYGVTEQGEKSEHALLVRGWQRAGALVALFAPDAATPPRAGLRRPETVYAAGPHGGKSLRPSETVTPLAAKLGTPLKLDHRTGDEAALARELLARHGTTLVSWEHHRISDIVKGLGRVHPAPPAAWPDDRFDLVWVFTRDGDGWTFAQVPQLLLDGDRPDPAR
ncbi:hypothetical protein ACFP1Z_15815 [Streptomyces gamaensis]|uniref:Histidine phosphatase family protein n=1 Tax=Streptomyces gamaensis TaxID=1763542 RepID=A0ABW0Z3M5_9ACTN